jgi:hypothetical protein
MASEVRHPYRFLDTAEDRYALVEDIHRVRQDVLRAARLVPRDRWYQPRYHGWSLAAMLGHLQLMDRLQLWQVSLAVLGINPHFSRSALNSLNNRMAKVYRERRIESTVRGLENYERKITDFILRLPMDRFSKPLYHPALETTLTVEQAIQEYFLYHWREHLHTMRLTDDIHYEPPDRNLI